MKQIHVTEHTTVRVMDEPDPKAGGACHQYEVVDSSERLRGDVRFQHGPIGEAGANGLQHLDLLKILEHRLRGFQSGPLASTLNEVCLNAIQAAIAADEERTARREALEAEGTSQEG